MSTLSTKKGCLGRIPEILRNIANVFQIAREGRKYDDFVKNNTGIMKRICFQMTPKTESQQSSWMYYPNWPPDWKKKLKEHYISFAIDGKLKLLTPPPLSNQRFLRFVFYKSRDVALDVFLAQVAHVLWVEIGGLVPWKLSSWTENELDYLLSSKVLFEPIKIFDNSPVLYGVHESSRYESTENILGDPRIIFRFLQKEPEQKKNLIGSTPSETCIKISSWFHDHLWHNPGEDDGYNRQLFHQKNPLLTDRLKKHLVKPNKSPVYLTPGGCGSASSLFADLCRSVNIPIRKVNNTLQDFDNTYDSHSGILFNWQGANSRYLIHTDNLYYGSYFVDPAPNPPSEERGIGLWDHVWLNATDFGNHFTYESNTGYFGKATTPQAVKYWNYRGHLAVSVGALKNVRNISYQHFHGNMKPRGLTDSEIKKIWNTVQSTIKAYGNGDLNTGFKVLLDGPNSRHQKWCNRTGKC